MTSRARFERIAGSLCTLAACAAIVSLAMLVAREAVDVPFWDEWDWTAMIVRAHVGTLTFGDLWALHNEHRMLFPSMITLALDRIAGWNQVVECFSSIIVVVGEFFMLAALLRSAFRGLSADVMVLCAALLLFSPVQVENWLWGFQTAWFLIDAMIVGIAYALSRERLTRWHVWAAVACAVVASYSSAFGLVSLPAGIAVLLARADRAPAVLRNWIAMSVAVTALYLAGYQTPYNPDAHIDRSHVIVPYFFAWLGMPFARFGGTPLAIVFGIAGFLAAVILFAFGFAKRRARPSSLAGLYGLIVFALGADALTAYGRSPFGLEQSLAGRYTTTSTIFWLGLIALAYANVRSLKASRNVRIPVTGIALAASIALAWAFTENVRYAFSDVAALHLRLETGLAAIRHYTTAHDEEIGSVIYPDAKTPRADMTLLATIGDGPQTADTVSQTAFATNAYALGGADTYAVDGRVTGTQPLSARTTESIGVSGWAADPVFSTPGTSIELLVDRRPVPMIENHYRLARPDVAKAESNAALENTGFSLRFAAAGLAAGKHVLTLCVVGRTPGICYRVGIPKTFTVATAP